MAGKKRHHFIPKFYLKRFSIKGEGNFIGLYNHKSDVFIPAASLQHQGYINFLYGKSDDIENALASMENEIAKMFYYWTEKKQFFPPPENSNGFVLLKRFILYQAYRTPQAGDDITESINEGLNTFLKAANPDLSQKLEGKKVIHENPVLLGLANASLNEDSLKYLGCRFIVNLSELPLITSDAPVIFYNQLMEAAQNYIGATALIAKGLQIFYPIHPRLIICLYDTTVYDLGNGCTNCCSIDSIDEINQLNALQFINSRDQLFFDDLIPEEYVRELCTAYSEYRKTTKNINKVLKSNSSKFLFTAKLDPQINLSLSCFRLLVNPKDYKNPIGILRHPSFERPRITRIDFNN